MSTQHLTSARLMACAAAAALLGASLALAGTLEDGFAAFSRGDYATAAREWSASATAGDVRGAFLLGMLYESGRGVTTDEARAMQLYQQAAEHGNADAQFRLGMLNQFGKGNGTHDAAAGFRWLQKAATQGDARAMGALGNAWATGHGTTKDYTQALTWLDLAIVRYRFDDPEPAELKTALDNRRWLELQGNLVDKAKAEAQADDWTKRLPALPTTAWRAPASMHSSAVPDYTSIGSLVADARASAGSADHRHYVASVALAAEQLVSKSLICIPPTMPVEQVSQIDPRDLDQALSMNTPPRVLINAELKREFACDSAKYKYW